MGSGANFTYASLRMILLVIPAQAGIHVDVRCIPKIKMDSGLRRNDGTKSGSA
jgi:hypothetical protein